MSCCGSPGKPSEKWELTLPSGEKRIFLTRVEASVAATSAGGGTIRKVS